MTQGSLKDVESAAPGNLRDKYAIVGVGETAYTRDSGRTTRHMGVEAVRNALADAGLEPGDVDGMMSYMVMDSTMSPTIGADMGMRLNYYMDVLGGGSSIEALIGLAIGVIEAGMCNTVAIFRSMNGATGARMGGSGRVAPAISGDGLFSAANGQTSPAQIFAHSFMRHMYEFGTTPEQVAHVKVFHSWGASNNPKAYYSQRVTVDDVLSSRPIAYPLHLLDCCVETDNATCLIVTSAERARDLKHTPARILSVVGRCMKPRMDMHYQHGPITRVAGYYARDILWPNAGVGPEDVDVTGSYDAFSFTTLLQLEDYGFCAKGEGGDYVSDGTIGLGGRRPNNTAGGHLCEGYTHGMNMVIENVRQLRGEVDDYCPLGPDGRRQHTYEYSEGGCRQVRDCEISANLGWGMPNLGSALVMRKG
ncbi:MAG: thiolase [Proteobacteria bacterium]|nr:thiolase [Pseudomonadota bacterium]